MGRAGLEPATQSYEVSRSHRPKVVLVQPSWDIGPGFDLPGFLQVPRVARLATVWNGEPRVRPVWYLFDERAFWWLTGPWSVIDQEIRVNPMVELVVDSCDLESGQVLQVRARGRAEASGYDHARAVEWAERYLGSDRNTWGRFAAEVFENPSTTFMRLAPDWLRARDLSW